MSPTEYKRRLATLKSQPVLQSMVKEILFDHQEEIRAIKAQEFAHGERPDGSIIGTYRSPFYSKKKYLMNPIAGGKVDLMLTGSFIESASLVNVRTNVYKINFADSKSGKLIGQYGNDIQGLNQATFNKFLGIRVKDEFVKDLKQRAKIR